MELLSATSSVWPVTGIYLLRAGKRIAVQRAAAAALAPSAAQAASSLLKPVGASKPLVSSEITSGETVRQTDEYGGPVRKSRYGVDGDLPYEDNGIGGGVSTAVDPRSATGLQLPATARIMMVGNSDGLQVDPDVARESYMHEFELGSNMDGTAGGSIQGGAEAGGGLPLGPPRVPALRQTSRQQISSDTATAHRASSGDGGTAGLTALTQAAGMHTTQTSAPRHIRAGGARSSTSQIPSDGYFHHRGYGGLSRQSPSALGAATPGSYTPSGG